jgi:glycosyltransferase involved in cell wall biosynthesis
MKVLLCVHGYPDELVGGTELAVASLARALARRGDDVLVVAGSVERSESGEVEAHECSESIDGGGSLRIRRLIRPDLYFDHWQKSRSTRIAEVFRELLREEVPDVIHVHHWIRLTRDLAAIAAGEGIPAVITLHDQWVSCPLAFRVRPRDAETCEKPLSIAGCIPCVSILPPRTPWVPVDMQYMEFARRESDLVRELRLARALVVPTAGHGERLQSFLGAAAEDLHFEAIPPAAPPRMREEAPIALPGDGRPLRLGSWGRHSRLKGTDFLFGALEEFGPEGAVELVLAGEEDPPGLVEELVKRHPRVRVVQHGPFHHEQLESHPVRDVHAMIHAGRAMESFGLVLEEARALRLPAILPDQGAFADRAGETSGALLYSPGDGESLRSLLANLLENPERLAALRALVPVAVREEGIVDSYVRLYERIVAEGAPSGADVPATEWFTERMERFAEEEWDRSLSSSSAEELGFL